MEPGAEQMLTGVVRGKTIELDQDCGLPDGQKVRVDIRPIVPTTHKALPPGEGLKRSFGAWADSADDLDRYLEWNRQQRKVSRPEIEP